LGIDLAKLISAALRYTPTRICVGEIRKEGASEVLDAWSTGHRGGLLTFHAGSFVEGLDRFRNLAARPGGLPSRMEIAKAIDDVIVVTKHPGAGRRIEIAKVLPSSENDFAWRKIA
jgi:type IV secretion system protein VirB11